MVRSFRELFFFSSEFCSIRRASSINLFCSYALVSDSVTARLMSHSFRTQWSRIIPLGKAEHMRPQDHESLSSLLYKGEIVPCSCFFPQELRGSLALFQISNGNFPGKRLENETNLACFWF